MKPLLCLNLLNVVLVGALHFPHHHHHHNFQQLATPKLEIVFPPIENRNPSKCELYEKIELPEGGGCQQVCKLSGRLGGIQISGASLRHPDGFCKPTGHVCKLRAEDRVRLNSTSQFGQCSQNCECVPLTEHELHHRHRELFFNEFLSSSSHILEVKTLRDLKKLPFEVKLSPTESRFPDKCERFEIAYVYESSDAGNFHEECKVSCRVQGSIGSVNFHLPSRSLNKNKPDGTSCHLKVHRTSDVLVSGAKQSIRGKCRAGFCITEDTQILQNRILSSLTSTPVTTNPHAAPTGYPITTSPPVAPTGYPVSAKSPQTFEYVSV